jgi:hypothetical protein
MFELRGPFYQFKSVSLSKQDQQLLLIGLFREESRKDLVMLKRKKSLIKDQNSMSKCNNRMDKLNSSRETRYVSVQE